MKRILTVILLALPLMACAGESIFKGGTSVLATAPNPITRTMLYNVENGLTVAVASLVGYKRLCVQKLIDQSCRGVIVKLQSYTIKAKPILISLRSFVRNNDQVNAITAYATISQLLSDFRAAAAANGVK